MRGGSDAEVAGLGVAGGREGVETRFGDLGGVAGGVRGLFSGSRGQNQAAGSALRGFSFPREPAGKLRLGVGLGTGGRAEAAVFSCKSRRRCRTATTATSPRRRTASAAVTARRPRCVSGTQEAALRLGTAPGQKGPGGELGGDPSGCGAWELPGCREKVGKPKTSRGTDAGGWGCSRYGEPAGGVFKGPAM